MLSSCTHSVSTDVRSASPAQQHQASGSILGDSKSQSNAVVVPAQSFVVGGVGLYTSEQRFNFWKVGFGGITKRVWDCFSVRPEPSTQIVEEVIEKVELQVELSVAPLSLGRSKSSTAHGVEDIFAVAPLGLNKKATFSAAPGAEESLAVAPLGLGKKATFSAAPGAVESLVVAPLAFGKKKKRAPRSSMRTAATNKLPKTVRFEDAGRPSSWKDWHFHKVIPILVDEPTTCRVGLDEVNLLHPSFCGAVDDGRAFYDGQWLPYPGKAGYEARVTPPEINDEGTRAVIKEFSDAARERNRIRAALESEQKASGLLPPSDDEDEDMVALEQGGFGFSPTTL
jgi:hypothetical protein